MLVRLFSIMVGVSVVVVTGALGFMAADRRIPIETLSVQTTALKVRPGGVLEFDRRFIQHRRCEILIDRVIIGPDGRQFSVPNMEYLAGIGPVGSEQKLKVSIQIPTDVVPGIARYEATSFYKCNILHELWPVVSPYSPIFFEVALLL